MPAQPARKPTPASATASGVRAWPAVVTCSATLMLAAPAWAITTEYQCTGYRPLTVSTTPQQAHVQFEGQDWTLRRVRDAREARYTSARDQVTIVARGRVLAFDVRGQHLDCKLLSDALDERRPASAPPARR